MPRPSLTSDENYRWFERELQPIDERRKDLDRRVEEWRKAELLLIEADKQALIMEAHEERGLSRNAICRALGITSGVKQVELWGKVFEGRPILGMTRRERKNPGNYMEGWGWKATWEIVNRKAGISDVFSVVNFTSDKGHEFSIRRVGVNGGSAEDWPLDYRWDYSGATSDEDNNAKMLPPDWCWDLIEAVKGTPEWTDKKLAEIREMLAAGKGGPRRMDGWRPGQPEPEPEEVTPYRDELDELDDVPLVVKQVSPDDAEWES